MDDAVLVVDPRYSSISACLAATPTLLRRVRVLIEADPSQGMYEAIIRLGKDMGDTGRSVSSPHAMIAARELAETIHRDGPGTPLDLIDRTIARLEGTDR